MNSIEMSLLFLSEISLYPPAGMGDSLSSPFLTNTRWSKSRVEK